MKNMSMSKRNKSIQRNNDIEVFSYQDTSEDDIELQNILPSNLLRPGLYGRNKP